MVTDFILMCILVCITPHYRSWSINFLMAHDLDLLGSHNAYDDLEEESAGGRGRTNRNVSEYFCLGSVTK